MTIEITPQNIILFFSLLGAIVGIVTYFAKIVRWVDKQKKQDEDLKALRNTHNEDQKYINEELTLLTYGVLACLKGLKEQGCNGPVTEAVDKIEKHLNKSAHNT